MNTTFQQSVTGTFRQGHQGSPIALLSSDVVSGDTQTHIDYVSRRWLGDIERRTPAQSLFTRLFTSYLHYSWWSRERDTTTLDLMCPHWLGEIKTGSYVSSREAWVLSKSAQLQKIWRQQSTKKYVFVTYKYRHDVEGRDEAVEEYIRARDLWGAIERSRALVTEVCGDQAFIRTVLEQDPESESPELIVEFHYGLNPEDTSLETIVELTDRLVSRFVEEVRLEDRAQISMAWMPHDVVPA